MEVNAVSPRINNTINCTFNFFVYRLSFTVFLSDSIRSVARLRFEQVLLSGFHQLPNIVNLLPRVFTEQAQGESSGFNPAPLEKNFGSVAGTEEITFIVPCVRFRNCSLRARPSRSSSVPRDVHRSRFFLSSPCDLTGRQVELSIRRGMGLEGGWGEGMGGVEKKSFTIIVNFNKKHLP